VKNFADHPLDYWITRNMAPDAPDLHLSDSLLRDFRGLLF
jgi:hypothetical protein